MVNPVSFSLFFIILDMSVQKSVEKLDETFESKDKRVVNLLIFLEKLVRYHISVKHVEV